MLYIHIDLLWNFDWKSIFWLFFYFVCQILELVKCHCRHNHITYFSWEITLEIKIIEFLTQNLTSILFTLTHHEHFHSHILFCLRVPFMMNWLCEYKERSIILPVKITTQYQIPICKHWHFPNHIENNPFVCAFNYFKLLIIIIAIWLVVVWINQIFEHLL